MKSKKKKSIAVGVPDNVQVITREYDIVVPNDLFLLNYKCTFLHAMHIHLWLCFCTMLYGLCATSMFAQPMHYPCFKRTSPEV